jgi:phosphohistidine phosphatase
MRLYVVRHAWAGEHGDPRWPNDADRPLTHEGKERFRRVIRKLSERGIAPHVIATSPYVRARQTAEILAKGVDGKPEVIDIPGLASGGDWHSALDWACTREEEEIAFVGHMPDLGEMSAAMIGCDRRSIGFAKGAIAAIDFPSHPTVGEGLLCWLVTAKLLGC